MGGVGEWGDGRVAVIVDNGGCGEVSCADISQTAIKGDVHTPTWSFDGIIEISWRRHVEAITLSLVEWEF